MDILFLILISLAATILAWLYLDYQQKNAKSDVVEDEENEDITTDDAADDKKEEQKDLQSVDSNINIGRKISLPKGKRLGFLATMFVVLSAMSVFLERFYIENKFVMNARSIWLLAILFVAASIDARQRIIPNKLVLFGLCTRVVFWIAELLTDPNQFLTIIKYDLYACLLIIAFFIIGVLLVKGGIGMGDIKLMLVMGLYQGFYGVVSSLFTSLFVAFIYAIIVLIFRKKTKKDSVAFAPAILLGTLISVFLTGM